MKIAFVTRSTLFIQPGGDTQQVEQSAAELSQLGVQVDVITNQRNVDLSEYDLVHFFNLGRPADLIRHRNWDAVPLFISTIWVEYNNSNRMETLKTLARGILGNDRIPPFSYLTAGQEKSMQQILQRADLLITTTEKEVMRLQQAFGDIAPTYVVPPGINRSYSEELPEEREERRGVLVVGRFEEIKNQKRAIEGLAQLHENITFVGDAASNNPSYLTECKKLATNNMSFRPHSSMEALKMLYRSHKVVLVPSTFETFGLTALEGLSQGCEVVLSTSAGAYELLKDYVHAINPLAPDDIARGVEEALQTPTSSSGRAYACQYTWKRAAETLHKLYETRLNA
ncbi:glycosyltransferase family 4 protein [Phaeocystidibacter marisrubri]|uniref:Glycosyltransferase family 4 protein n=1 Tax=Phaeocystidibacter marisrubri TaxID=1577780 RepID=A0A6L3ZHJ0_9FLAO|nr:glycosyltransferase family 4 protein [Phaeocystidibacter marisrubri]KAB2817058.1 glycosyltransferase family 4 protein [Phaeocystidibacter marisrubri]GGH77027.1 glycosyl transferase [Phaeocystidibacter marisrubri]